MIDFPINDIPIPLKPSSSCSESFATSSPKNWAASPDNDPPPPVPACPDLISIPQSRGKGSPLLVAFQLSPGPPPKPPRTCAFSSQTPRTTCGFVFQTCPPAFHPQACPSSSLAVPALASTVLQSSPSSQKTKASVSDPVKVHLPSLDLYPPDPMVTLGKVRKRLYSEIYTCTVILTNMDSGRRTYLKKPLQPP